MSPRRCPVARPLAWTPRGPIGYARAGFRSVVPANDLLSGRVCRYGCAYQVLGGPLGARLGVGAAVGVVGFLPVAPPLAWSSPFALSLPSTTAVPAKEKKKQERTAQPTTGGGA
jgi:hypothetical protein